MTDEEGPPCECCHKPIAGVVVYDFRDAGLEGRPTRKCRACSYKDHDPTECNKSCPHGWAPLDWCDDCEAYVPLPTEEAYPYNAGMTRD